jgi:predicted ATPase
MLEPGVKFDDLVWRGNAGLPVKFRVWFADDPDEEPGYVLEISKGYEGWSVTRERFRTESGCIEIYEDQGFEHDTEGGGTIKYNAPLPASLRFLVYPYSSDVIALEKISPILKVREKLGSAWRYRPSADDIASFVSYPQGPGQRQHVAPNGYGVARQIQELQGSNRAVFQQIEQSLCQIFPHIEALGFDTNWQGVRLSFKTNRSVKLIPAPQESDGVLLATFLFWRLFTGGPSTKVCLEEPENGLHPFLLCDRFLMLKRFSYPEGDRPAVQLLVSTHSPEFLRAIKAHPTALWRELRVVEFDEDTGTSVRKLSGYREAAHLYADHLDASHERWAPLAEA